MEQIIITHKNGTTLKLNSKENVSAVKKATQQVDLLGVDVVDLSVESAKKMNFYIGDKITIIGRDYTLNTPAKERKISENRFQYDMQFEGVQYDLLRATYNVNIDTTSNKIQDINGDAITGDIKMFLDVLISNANRVFGTGKWVLGTYPSNTKTLTLTFSDSDNCLSVLQNLCGEDNFNTEFKIAIDGSGNRTINVGAIGNNFTYTFQYGKGKGIYELTREKVSSSNIITRLNCFGSSKNIITPKYRASKLCLPTKTKSQSFLENSTAISTYGIWEGSKDFDDVYPHRTGVISSLGANVFEFIDSSMDFDLNEKNVDGTTKYLMAGTSAKISFNTGNLAGYEFEVNKYDAVTKKFTIISQQDQNDYIFPSTTTAAFQFAVGDKYIISDIYMPQSYIDTAEAELATKGAAYLAKYSQPLVQYGLTLDSNFLKNQVGANASSNIVWVGDYIPIKDTDLEVDKTIRVKGFTRDLMLDYSYQLTIADLSISVSTITRVITGMDTIDKVIKINNLNDPARARRNWKDSQEVLNMVFDTEGDFYTDKIKPLSIETSMLSVGAKSMQFGLEGTIFQPNYLGAKNRVVYVGGMLSHYAILDSNNNPAMWFITDGDVTLNSDNARYVYAKCSRSSTAASIFFTSEQVTVDSDGAYYHFLIGILNSVDINNTRALALMYGFSTINGRFIKTGRIQSADGITYFDLDAGEFKGVIKFTSGVNVETAVNNAQAQANTAVTNAATAQTTANNAATAASNAATAAANAQTSANTANTEISNISSDNILSPLEKSGERNRWNIVSAEKSGINSQATTFGITTENTNYNTAFQALANYLNAGTTWSTGIPSWISDANLSSNTIIVGATYRTTWESFYASRQTLMNSISAKAKTLADSAQTQANTATTNAANAQTTANNAATAASTAQTSANTANALLTDIASDDKITPSEKQAMKLEWDIIFSEKTKNDTQATAFGVSKTAYGTAYTNLSGQIGANLNDLNSTWSLGTGGGVSLRSYFKTYYDARTDLLNAIAAKAKTLADTAQSTANNIQVGGRNLLLNSKTGTTSNFASDGDNIDYYTDKTCLLKAGTEYIVTGTSPVGLNWNDDMGLDPGDPSCVLLLKGADTVVYGGFLLPGQTFTVPITQLYTLGTKIYKAGTYTFSNIKIEIGNKASDWTAAPEDVDAVIATKAKHFTGTSNPTTPYTQGIDIWTNGTELYECAVTRISGSYVAGDFVKATGYDNTQTVIDGGIVTSGTLQVAGDSNILAGMTGQNTGSTAVRMWAGASFASRNIAPFRVQQDGKVYMSNAEILGKVTASSGAIGDWRISGGGMINDSTSAYIIGRQSGISGNSEARIGSNVVSAATGYTIPSYIMNTIENQFADNIALLIEAKHGYENKAIVATGDIIMTVGDAISSKLNYINLAGVTNVIYISKGLKIYVKNTTGLTKSLYLPGVTDIRDYLFISTFSVTSAAAVSSTTATVYYVAKGNGLFVGDAIKYSTSAYQTITDIIRYESSTYDKITVETTLGIAVANGGTFTAIHEFSIEILISQESLAVQNVVNVYPNNATFYNNDGTSLTSVSMGRGDIMKVLCYTRKDVMYYQLVHYKTA